MREASKAAMGVTVGLAWFVGAHSLGAAAAVGAGRLTVPAGFIVVTHGFTTTGAQTIASMFFGVTYIKSFPQQIRDDKAYLAAVEACKSKRQ